MSSEIDVKVEQRLVDVTALKEMCGKFEEQVGCLAAAVKSAESHATGLGGYVASLLKIAELSQQCETLRQGQEQADLLLANKEEVESKLKEQLKVLSSLAVFLPDDVLTVFGLHRDNLGELNAKPMFPAIRAWCNFIEWASSQDANPGEFEKQFAKVDVALAELRDTLVSAGSQILSAKMEPAAWGNESAYGKTQAHFKMTDSGNTGSSSLEEIRKRVSEAVRNHVSRNLRADFRVDWDFVGKTYDEKIHHAESLAGSVIEFVRSALITRDENVLARAKVEVK